VLPPLDPETGRLPEGEHETDWTEVVERFGWNHRRRRLLDGFADARDLLAAAGCRRVWLNGSFVTAKEEPGDFDGCRDSDGVDLDALDPVLLDLSNRRAAQKEIRRRAVPECARGAQRFGFRRVLPGRARHRTEGNRGNQDRRRQMITNDVQYRATQAHLRQFEEALANLEKTGAGNPSKLAVLEIDAVRAQADELRAEVEEYERLRSGQVSTFEASTLAALATLLVKARIARGWTQRRLAEALGIAEQQVQRYESTGYCSASLARICDVAAALGVTITETGRLTNPDAA